MKKSLIAMAALAAVGVASAQSSVTLSGNIKTGFSHLSLGGAGSGSQNALVDGSSRFILSGTEDLGGGLRARFQIDNRFRSEDSPFMAQAGGSTWVGLQGGFGMVQLGKLDVHYCTGADTHAARATSLGASSCGLLGFVNGSGGDRAIANTSRIGNVIQYMTPNFSGLTGRVNYSTGFGSGASANSDGAPGATSKGDAWSLGLAYAAGPLNLQASFWRARSENRTVGASLSTNSDQNAWTLAGNYNFGVATVGLTYDQSEVNLGTVGGPDAKNKRSAWSVPVTVPVGSGTLLFTYTKANSVKLNGVNQPNTDANLLSIGYDYALSKRTSIGASYARLDNKAAANYRLYVHSGLGATIPAGAGVDQSQFYIGVRHAF